MIETATQPRLLTVPVCGVVPVRLAEANDLLTEWEHKLGPVNRPFRSEPWVLEVDGRPVAVAVTCSIVSPHVAGYRIQEVVELARLCSAPDQTWATRPMLRLWREVLAPRWGLWPVKAAVSYSHNGLHKGDIYRFDGWTKVRSDAGSYGGGTWSTKRKGDDPIKGTKSLWIWRYQQEEQEA